MIRMRAKSLLSIKRVLWAVDPFTEQMDLQRAALSALQMISKHSSTARVQPIYLVNDYSSEIPERLVRSFLDKIALLGQDSIEQLSKGAPRLRAERLIVLSRPFESVRQGTEELLTYAQEHEADLIVVSTHGTGSFSETLISRSDLPLLVVNPHGIGKTIAFKCILFPTDFSLESHEWFRSTLQTAKRLGSTVTIFHRLEQVLSPSRETTLRIFPHLQEQIFKNLAASQEEANRWAAEAKRAGVKAKVLIENATDATFSDVLLNYVEEQPSTVVVAPPLSASLPGSTLRNIARRSPGPLWIIPTLLRTHMAARPEAWAA